MPTCSTQQPSTTLSPNTNRARSSIWPGCCPHRRTAIPVWPGASTSTAPPMWCRPLQALPVPPLLIFASSAAVYGSVNPYRHPERITAQTPLNPIDQYGEDKVLAEAVIERSGLPYALLRLGGVVAPDGAANLNGDYLLLMRATPGDNRLHTVDARDVALAFANAVDRADDDQRQSSGHRRQRDTRPRPPRRRRRHVRRGRHRAPRPQSQPARRPRGRPWLGIHRMVRHHRITGAARLPTPRLGTDDRVGRRVPGPTPARGVADPGSGTSAGHACGSGCPASSRPNADAMPTRGR